MRHGLKKDGMPKKHDPKKMDTSMSMKKKKGKRRKRYLYSHVLMISK
jgi:hypothetical protein